MDSTRREFLIGSGKLLLLTSAAATAWEFVLAGRPEDAPNYRLNDHWWAMTIDIERCIGCGNCVRACKTENDVPLEPSYFRTWVERYRVPPPDPRHPQDEVVPDVDSPNDGYDGFPKLDQRGAGWKTFFVPVTWERTVGNRPAPGESFRSRVPPRSTACLT